MAALSLYLRARFQLAGLEAKEAMVHYAIIAGLFAGGLMLLVFGYFFAVMFLVFGIAALIGGQHTWLWVTLGAVVLHFGLAAALVLIARAKLAAPMFAATLEEFKKDNQWFTATARQN